MVISELIILCALFWRICYLNTGSDDKNIKSYASYSDEAQEMIKKNPVLQSKTKAVSPVTSFVSNILVFGVVLFIFGLFVKEDGFKDNFMNAKAQYVFVWYNHVRPHSYNNWMTPFEARNI